MGLSNSFSQDKIDALRLMTIGYFADVKVILVDVSKDLVTRAKDKINNLRNRNNTENAPNV